MSVGAMPASLLAVLPAAECKISWAEHFQEKVFFSLHRLCISAGHAVLSALTKPSQAISTFVLLLLLN